MLYGELVINGKHDYQQTNIYNRWLCFGVLLRPAMVTTKDNLGQFVRCCCCQGLGIVEPCGHCPLCDGAGFHSDEDAGAEVRLSLALRAAGYNATPKQNKVL